MHAITKISEKEKGLKIEKEREGENERGKIEKGREGSYTGTRIERSIKSGKGGKGEIGKMREDSTCQKDDCNTYLMGNKEEG